MLPSISEFMKAHGLGGPVEKNVIVQSQMEKERNAVKAYLSEEFRKLLIQYCASFTAVYELKDISWMGLQSRLGTRAEHLKAAAEQLDSDGTLWQDVIGERIRRAGGAKAFRDLSWEKLESMAQAKLIHMMERGLIKDVGELLAVSSTARRAQTSTPSGGGGTNVAVNVFNGANPDDSGLPAAGHKMTIDLSPRAADALQRSKERTVARNGDRVIDGQMISAAELRNMLEQKEAIPISEQETETEAVTSE
jgi:hypothetical protein